MADKQTPPFVSVFSTDLGWMALVGRRREVSRLLIGYGSRKEAIAAVAATEAEFGHDDWYPELADQLRAYAAGEPVEFGEVRVDLGPIRPFTQRVVACCRKIRRGTTCTYGQLAAEAGSPGAARAVGQCMARNPVPIIIPCHRVVASDGSLDGYSAPQGLVLKRKILSLEGAL